MHHSIDISKLAAAAAHPLSTSAFDHVLNRLQNLTLPEAGLQKHPLDGETVFVAYPQAEERTVIDTFAPRRTAHDRSPASSQSSSDAEYSSSSNYSASQPASPTAAAHEAFYATRSRVVRVSGDYLQFAQAEANFFSSCTTYPRWRRPSCPVCFSRKAYARVLSALLFCVYF